MSDVIVVGLGAMGSAAAYCLAQRGKRVLGLDQFTAAHDRGSSHGGSRMIRQSYWEDSAYVPILLRAYELWQRLEHDANTRLLHITGGLALGTADSQLLSGCLQSAKAYGLAHEVLEPRELRRRFPPFVVKSDEIGFFEYAAGYLLPEECIRQFHRQAERCGAELHFEEPVESWQASGDGTTVTVKTKHRVYSAGHLIVSAGAWAQELLADLQLPLTVTRQVMFWFHPLGSIQPFLAGGFPVYMCAPHAGEHIFYGFPAIDGKDVGPDFPTVLTFFVDFAKPGLPALTQGHLYALVNLSRY